MFDTQAFQIAKDASAHDTLVDLLDSIDSILKHLEIYTKIPPTAAMTGIIVKTLLELLSVFALATKLVKQGQPGKTPLTDLYLAQCNAEKLVRKFSGGKYEDMVLERLDRLTLDEARITAEQILEVVYGLVQNMRVIMDGEQRTRPATRRWPLSFLRSRRQDINRPCSGCSG
jgi:hypothetical protein